MRKYNITVAGKVVFTGSYHECFEAYIGFAPADSGVTCEEVAYAIDRCITNARLYSKEIWEAERMNAPELKQTYIGIMQGWEHAIKHLNNIQPVDARKEEV